jgi:hypothetical protein
MEFLLVCRAIFMENVKMNKARGATNSCQLDKQFWSYELKQQSFSSSGRSGSQKNFLYFNFFRLDSFS